MSRPMKLEELTFNHFGNPIPKEGFRRYNYDKDFVKSFAVEMFRVIPEAVYYSTQTEDKYYYLACAMLSDIYLPYFSYDVTEGDFDKAYSLAAQSLDFISQLLASK